MVKQLPRDANKQPNVEGGKKWRKKKTGRGKKKRKPFCSSSQMGRLSVCITIMEFRAHWQKFTNSSQHPARINNVEALDGKTCFQISEQVGCLRHQTTTPFNCGNRGRSLAAKQPQRCWWWWCLVGGGGEVGLLALIWLANITPGGDDITAAAATLPLILF